MSPVYLFLIKKETPEQLYFSEVCKFLKNTFFINPPSHNCFIMWFTLKVSIIWEPSSFTSKCPNKLIHGFTCNCKLWETTALNLKDIFSLLIGILSVYVHHKRSLKLSSFCFPVVEFRTLDGFKAISDIVEVANWKTTNICVHTGKTSSYYRKWSIMHTSI